MRFLGVGDTNDLGAMYLALAAEGHECRVAIRDDEAGDTLAGMVTRVADWHAELGWIRAAGRDGAILFETAHDGATQDALRAEGFQVIGGSADGDRLENDRERGQRALAEAGLPVAPVHAFDDLAAGIDFVRRRPGRYVLKLSGGGFLSSGTYVVTVPPFPYGDGYAERPRPINAASASSASSIGDGVRPRRGRVERGGGGRSRTSWLVRACGRGGRTRRIRRGYAGPCPSPACSVALEGSCSRR